jgi:hypothetical protein
VLFVGFVVLAQVVGMVEKEEGTAFGHRGFGDTVWEGILYRNRVGGDKEGEHSPCPVPGIKILQKKSQWK